MNRNSRNSRRRSSTPNLKLSPAHLVALQTGDPASPPDTPVTSPDFPSKDNQAAIYLLANTLAQDRNIRPYGSGHQFSYRPLEQLSPRSSSSSEADEGHSIGGDSSESASVVSLSTSAVQLLRASAEMNALESHELDASGDADAESESESESEAEADCEAEPDKFKRARLAHGPAISIPEGCDFAIDFTIEDMDPMDSEWEGLDVVYPTEIESESDAESPPSQSAPEQRDLDQDMMQDLENLNCSNEASDDETEPDEDDEESEFRRRQQELRRIRRVSMSSSFGKRTHNELSDSDDNDCALDVNEAGSSARRFRKRVHRGSLLFQDPPAPRIDELEEPNSSEDEYANEMHLAQELPYHAMEIMDTDSS